MRKMRYLFMFERIAWNDPAKPARRQYIRTQHETRIVDEIFQRLRAEVKSAALLPKSKLAEAIGYMQTRERNFRHYLSDPALRMDNNTAERGLRKLTIGRKNWMFIGSEKAGESMAALLSIVQTCRAMSINPQDYLEYLFTHLLDHPANRLEELLPDQWQLRQAKSSTGKD